MSSYTVQAALIYLQLNNYTSVGYDYVLTFSDEVVYIWAKPWTWVSTLFLFVRYMGLGTIILSFILGSTFTPGNDNCDLRYLTRQCKIITIAYQWAFVLFLGATDFMMLLRVWAMYNRSRFILVVLLITIFCEMVGLFIYNAASSIPTNQLYPATTEMLNVSICSWGNLSTPWFLGVFILQMIHAVTLCALAIAQSVKHSIQMFRATKRWQINQYMNLLVKQGIFYFVANLLIAFLNLSSGILGNSQDGWKTVAFNVTMTVPVFALAPRFILSIRVLYARDIQGIERGNGVDSGFGLSSTCNAGESAIVFADVALNGGMEDTGEVPRKGVTAEPE